MSWYRLGAYHFSGYRQFDFSTEESFRGTKSRFTRTSVVTSLNHSTLLCKKTGPQITLKSFQYLDASDRILISNSFSGVIFTWGISLIRRSGILEFPRHTFVWQFHWDMFDPCDRRIRGSLRIRRRFQIRIKKMSEIWSERFCYWRMILLIVTMTSLFKKNCRVTANREDQWRISCRSWVKSITCSRKRFQ